MPNSKKHALAALASMGLACFGLFRLLSFGALNDSTGFGLVVGGITATIVFGVLSLRSKRPAAAKTTQQVIDTSAATPTKRDQWQNLSIATTGLGIIAGIALTVFILFAIFILYIVVKSGG